MIVAAFDFDGTLTYHDTLFPFLCFSQGTPRALLQLLKETPALLGYVCGVYSRQTAKEAVLGRFFEGGLIEELKRDGELFAKVKLPACLKKAGMERFFWHQQQGHRLVLISASIDAYLKPWADLHGFHDLICTRVEATKEGIVTGKIVGKNCWGPEKKARLEALLGPRSGYKLYVYGDSRGDREILDMADYPFYRTFQEGVV